MADKKKRRRVPRGASRSQPRRIPPLWAIGQGLLVLCLVGLLGWGIDRLLDPQTLPLRKVSIEGEFKHVSQAKLQEAVAAYARGGFFSVNLETVRAAAEELPWVAQAGVRRVWPDSLEIKVKEQVPLARWGEDALVSVEGKIFVPPRESFPKDLPTLQGPLGSEQLLAGRLRKMQVQLRPLELRVVQLTMGERRDWNVAFEDGMELVLGRAHSEQRLSRFRQIYARLLQLHREDIRRVDMRYTNGFAVTWRGDAAPAWVREAAFDV